MLRRLLTLLKRSFRLRQQHERFQPDLYLRIVREQRWRCDETGKLPRVEDAVADLRLRPGEKGLSLYKLQSEDETNELACVFSLALRDNPAHFEYVLFSANVLSGYPVEPVPVPEHPRFLSERHHEIPDPSEEQLLQLAERILGSPGKKTSRIAKQQIVAFAVQHSLLETKELRNRVGDLWRKLIQKEKGA